MSSEAFWARLQDPSVLLVVVVVLLGAFILKGLASIIDHLAQINDTMQSCLHELEELSQEPRGRAKLKRELEHMDRVMRPTERRPGPGA